ncbi:MAG: hypothetical protein FWH29_08290, partial [Methanobrevibacter sp.]|nr:hypothetical protein [Methanobrevibacter sp.]
MRTGLLIGILALIICGVVFLAAENNNYNNIHSEVDGLKITTPTGYEKSSESMTELELSNGNNVITVYSQNLEQLKSFNKKYSTLKSKNMDVDGINILFKEYEFSYINPYYYMFNINGKYFVINSQEESNETILSEMLAENNVSSSDKIELPDIEVEKEKPDSNKDSSTSTDSGYSGTEAIFTKNVL